MYYGAPVGYSPYAPTVMAGNAAHALAMDAADGVIDGRSFGANVAAPAYGAPYVGVGVAPAYHAPGYVVPVAAPVMAPVAPVYAAPYATPVVTSTYMGTTVTYY